MSPDATGRLYTALLTFFESAERGAPVDREALLADYPELSHELRDFLDTYELVERVAAPLRELMRRPSQAGCPRGPSGPLQLIRSVGAPGGDTGSSSGLKGRFYRPGP